MLFVVGRLRKCSWRHHSLVGMVPRGNSEGDVTVSLQCTELVVWGNRRCFGAWLQRSNFDLWCSAVRHLPALRSTCMKIDFFASVAMEWASFFHLMSGQKRSSGIRQMASSTDRLLTNVTWTEMASARWNSTHAQIVRSPSSCQFSICCPALRTCALIQNILLHMAKADLDCLLTILMYILKNLAIQYIRLSIFKNCTIHQ